jgi:hypothetical protein
MLMAIGCGKDLGFSIAPVSGTVAYRGQPLPGGRIVFHPLAYTPGPQAIGVIEADGTFQMQVNGVTGAAVGDHRVTIDYRRTPTEQESRNLVIPELLIPPKYADVDHSPLRCTVQKSTRNKMSIELVD